MCNVLMCAARGYAMIGNHGVYVKWRFASTFLTPSAQHGTMLHREPAASSDVQEHINMCILNFHQNVHVD